MLSSESATMTQAMNAPLSKMIAFTLNEPPLACMSISLS